MSSPSSYSPDLDYTLEGMRESLELLRGSAKDQLHFDNILVSLSVIMKASSRLGVYQCYRIQEDLPIVRVRPLETSGQWYRLREDLGPPPPDKTIELGRCHQPGQPVGYWSLYEDTALAELRAESNRQYLISTFVIPKGTLLLPVGEFDYFRRTGQTYLGHEFARSAKNYTDVLGRTDWHLLALFDAFVAGEFIKPAMNQADYKITSAIAKIFFQCDLGLGSIDAIVYPSVAFRQGTNFAVRDGLFKSKMKPCFAETRIVEVTDVLGYDIFSWRVLKTLKAIDSDGNVSWD